MRPLKIVIASTSAVKVDACRRAFGSEVDIVTVKVPSGVNEQPMDLETLQGANNRLAAARAAIPDADFYVAIESGLFRLFDEETTFVDRAIVVLQHQTGLQCQTTSDGVIFPDTAVEEARRRGLDKWTVGRIMQEQGIVVRRVDGSQTHTIVLEADSDVRLDLLVASRADVSRTQAATLMLFPLVIGGVVFTLLTTWKRGRALLMDKLAEDALPLDVFIQSIEVAPPTRVEGTAVFMTSTPDRVPHALLHNLKHNKVLHERVVFLTVVMRDIPYVDPEKRIEVKTLGCDFYQFLAYYGFKEDPDVPELLEESGRRGFAFDMMETSFFVSRETLIPTVSPGMAMWRERLFASMSKNAVKASEFFQIPTNRVVELGTQVEL